jgi:hypothetical protein
VSLRASPFRYSRLAASDTRADIKTHPRASLPLPERKLREAHSRNMLMLLWNISPCDHLAAIPPKADIGWERWHVHFVPKAGIVPLFHFYTVDGFSFWNSYAPICRSP